MVRLKLKEFLEGFDEVEVSLNSTMVRLKPSLVAKQVKIELRLNSTMVRLKPKY